MNTCLNKQISLQQKVNDACMELTELNLSHFVMYLIPTEGNPFVLSNIPSINNSYYYLNKDSTNGSDNVCARTFIYLTQQDHYLFVEQAPLVILDNNSDINQSSIYPVYNIIRHCSECTFVFSAISSTYTDDVESFYVKTVKDFESFCFNFVSKLLSSILSTSVDYKFSFILNQKSLLEAVIRQKYEKEISLTVREQECLLHSCLGKTSKEIADILHISQYTVEWHLKKIRKLFNCNKLHEIMIECMYRGLIGKFNTSLYSQKFN